MDSTDNNKQEVKTFKQTSNDLYNRHHYKLILSNGREIVFEDYMEVQAAWLQTANQFLSHIEVLDIKEKTKGFK